jgi:hypothetical protein
MLDARIVFHALIFDPPGAAEDAIHLVSKVVFDVEVEGRIHSHLFAAIRRPMMAAVDDESLEVSWDLPYKCKGFAEAARTYYRTVLEHHGTLLTTRGPKGMRSLNNVFSGLSMQVLLKVERIEPESSGGKPPKNVE